MRLKKLVFSLIALCMIFGSVPTAALAAPAAAPQPAPVAANPCTLYHTVWWGETLFQVGMYYGVSWTKLAKWNNIANPRYIYAGQVLCVRRSNYGTGGAYWNPYPWYGTGGAYYYYPSFWIASVVRNGSVTITTANFPANDTFQVLMGPYGTAAIGGIVVASINSGNGGSFTATFPIPAALYNRNRIAIRLQSPYSGYYAYNWFYNY